MKNVRRDDTDDDPNSSKGAGGEMPSNSQVLGTQATNQWEAGKVGSSIEEADTVIVDEEIGALLGLNDFDAISDVDDEIEEGG